MVKKIVFLSIITCTFFSCSEKNKKIKKLIANVAHGPVVYGGVFKMNELEDCRSLYPLNITEIASFHIVSQIYEGLVKFNQKDLTIMPCLAEKWDTNDDATIFTFHLRKGVLFQDDGCFEDGEGREVTASDFKFCFDRVCESRPDNQAFWIFKNKVVGANEYYQSTINKNPLPGGVSGIKVLDKYTLQIQLNHPFAGFRNILATSYATVFPKEAVEKYGDAMRVKCVGTGPFILTEVKEGESIIIERNNYYWDKDSYGNVLPYLDAVYVSFLKEKKSEFFQFKKGNLSMIFKLPFEMINDILGDFKNSKNEYRNFQLQVSPAMSIEYYGFQHKDKFFQNKYLRKAFNFAIDRQKIVDFTLQGEGVAAISGIVPPAFKEYDVRKVRGYEFNLDSAKSNMSKAGFPNGKGLPAIILQLNSGGTQNSQIAEVVQKMLKDNINVRIELNTMPLAQHLENIETGKASFWRAGWTADYPDPESFLNLFYSPNMPVRLSDKSYINSFRYKSAKFDSLFVLALKETDRTKRYNLYYQADQVAMDDAAIIPLYYQENCRLIQPEVRNLDINAMEYRDLKKVYFEINEIKTIK